jgi:hypothetical protein
MTIAWRMPVLVCRCVKVGGAVPARSGHRRPAATAAAGRPGGGSPAQPVDLEPLAKAVAVANAILPYVFDLGPDQGRRTVDAVQSGPVNKLPVDIQDTTVPGGPSGQVSVRILRQPAVAGDRLPPRRRLGLPATTIPTAFGRPGPGGSWPPRPAGAAPRSAGRRAGDLAVEHVVPLGLGVAFGGPPAGRAASLVSMSSMQRMALCSSCRRCSPSSTTTMIWETTESTATRRLTGFG